MRDIKSMGNQALAEILPITETGRRLQALLYASPKYQGNAKALSLDAGLGETAVTDIISGRSKKPRRYTLRQIADQLGCTAEDIQGIGETVVSLPMRRQTRRDDVIPIRSAGRGGDSQEMFTDDVVGYTSRPANLSRVLQAYAVYVVGTSMTPRYEPGWLIHVHPSKPPTKGRDVVVYKHDNSVLVKTFIEHTARELVLSQMNPPAEIRISSGDVKEFHLIVGVDQEGG